MSNVELVPDAVTYENIKKNKTEQTTTSQCQDLNLQALENTEQYQDLDLRTPENIGQYQELVKETETSVKLVNNNPDITYENTKMEGQNKSEPKNQSEQSQYEELNTGNEVKEEHAYSEVSLR